MKVQTPSRLFSMGLEAILVGAVWYHMIQSRHITGNPLNFFPLCLFHSSACDSSHAVTYMGLTGFNATYSPAHIVPIGTYPQTFALLFFQRVLPSQQQYMRNRVRSLTLLIIADRIMNYRRDLQGLIRDVGLT